MKKNSDRRNGKSRHLTLHRETLQILNDPALLEVVQGQVYQQIGITTMTQTQTGYEAGGGC
jgi:hypothetical protein